MPEQPSPPTWKQFRSAHPAAWWFLWIEWLGEWTAFRLKRWAIIDLLEIAARFGIVIAVVGYCTGAEERRKLRYYQAWQVINSARGSRGDGGRREAMQDLVEDRQSLAGLDVVGADLPGVALREANLRSARLDSTGLEGAVLTGSDLTGASFTRGRLGQVDFTDARLVSADLRGADLKHAILVNAKLMHANLSAGSIAFARLEGANLSDANLCRTYMYQADLRGVRMDDTNLRGAFLIGVDLRGAELRSFKGEPAVVQAVNVARTTPTSDPELVRWLISRGAVEIADSVRWEEHRDSVLGARVVDYAMNAYTWHALLDRARARTGRGLEAGCETDESREPRP